MGKLCRFCGQAFEISAEESNFLKKMAFRYGAAEIILPEPEDCPECRQQIRTAHRNERHLYHRNSDLGGGQIIALYPAEAPWGEPYKVYSPEEWYSDEWDPLDYGRDYDFNRPFFEQFSELHKAVPRLSLVAVGNENSPYTTGTGYCKNCHLINSSEYCEDCYYGKLLQSCKDCLDCSYSYDSELCYQCFSVYKCYGCIYLNYSSNCTDCWFSENLTGCSDCLFCTNLHQKRYCISNRQATKEEYQEALNQIKGSHRAFEEAREKLGLLRRERIHKYAQIVNSEGCTGDFIQNSKDCLECYDVNESRDCLYVAVGVKIKDVYDCSNMYIKCELNYQVLGTIETYHCAYCLYAFHSRDILYSEMTFHSNNLFGCVGLRRKEYCIFNKQYSKDEYNALVPKIIDQMKSTGDWGMFFPPQYAPHAYNESLAQEYFPLAEGEVLDRDWNWLDDTEKTQAGRSAAALPDKINEIDDSICQELQVCEERGKNYKILPQELRFYRKQQIPLPRLSPDSRYDQRLTLRNPRRLYSRRCDHCRCELLSTFSNNRPEKIYCEACFSESVYQ